MIKKTNDDNNNQKELIQHYHLKKNNNNLAIQHTPIGTQRAAIEGHKRAEH